MQENSPIQTWDYYYSNLKIRIIEFYQLHVLIPIIMSGFWKQQNEIYGVPEDKVKEKGSEKVLEDIIAENFLNMGKEIVKWSPGSTESQAGQTQGGKHWDTQ